MKPFLIMLAMVIVLVSCDRPECVNSNEVLSKNYFDSENYKRELSRLLKESEASAVDYWFDMYIKKGLDEYIDVHVQSDQICAEAHILVTDWTKLKGIRETGGLGYHGAKLKGLKFDIKQDSLHTEFIYKDIDTVID